MKKYFILFLLIGFQAFIPEAFAQTKILSIDETAFNRKLMPASLRNLQWMGNSGSFAWVSGNNLVGGKVVGANVDTLLRLSALNDQLATFKAEQQKRFPPLDFISDQKFVFTAANRQYLYDLASGKLSQINAFPEGADNTDLEPLTLKAAYTRDNNLYISSRQSTLTVTADSDAGIVNGQSVHRNEFGINKGTFWSPGGNYLAFYRMDQRMVTDYPLVNIDPRIATVKNTKYPMAGMTSHHVTLGVFDPETKNLVFMKTGEPADQYLTCVTWSPDEKYIFIALLNRDQNSLKLNQYEALTGNFVKTLFEEKDDKYVEPLHPLTFLRAHPGQFIWQSRRDGFNHLYLYDIQGNLLKQLTKGGWEVLELLGTDPEDKKVFFTCTLQSPLEKQLYACDLKNGALTQISSGKGTHSALMSADGKYFLDSHNSTEITSETFLTDQKGKRLHTLLESTNPLKDYKLGQMSLFTIKSADGSELYCRLIKPADFDPLKKYPVLVYLYGGPHEQMITETWTGGAGLFLNYMADHGYVVFTLDNHGSMNRGKAFEQAVFRNLGSLEAEDQMAGVNYLKTLSYVDTSRFGIYGWSYGGFMAINMMLRYPGVFKVGVAGGPVTDWKYYEVMYGERYMDTPETNPEGYKNASLLDKADKLQGKLLVIHGTMDETVVWQNSLQFIKNCVDQDKQVDYFVYPGHEHNVSGKDRVHMNQKIATYFSDFL